MPRPHHTESKRSPNPRNSDDVQTARQGTGAAQPPPGLDGTRHKAAQEAAQQADVLRHGLFSALMTTAVNINQFDDPHAFQTFLERLVVDSGNPTNPIAQMLIEQLALCHVRIAQLHISAAHADSLEAKKVYGTMAARLLGEFRRSAVALEVIVSGSSETKTKSKIKVFKTAG
jgi:hypothetical protein